MIHILLILMLTFNANASPDINQDGSVNFADFVIFAKHFGEEVPVKENFVYNLMQVRLDGNLVTFGYWGTLVIDQQGLAIVECTLHFATIKVRLDYYTRLNVNKGSTHAVLTIKDNYDRNMTFIFQRKYPDLRFLR